MTQRPLLAAIAVMLAACAGGGGAAPAPSPSSYRGGVLPLYFGALDSSAAAIAAQTGTIWTNGWGPEGYIVHSRRQLLSAQQMGATFAVLAVDTIMQADGQEKARVRALFDELRAAGVLSMVKWFFLYDEPEQHGFTAAQIAQARASLLEVASDYPELAGALVAINYGCANDFVGVESADVVSCDRYDRSASETHGNLTAKAKGKPIFEFAGVVEPFLSDPMPYVNEAMTDPKMIAVGFFLYDDFVGTGLGRGSSNTANTRNKDTCSAIATLRAARLTIC